MVFDWRVIRSLLELAAGRHDIPARPASCLVDTKQQDTQHLVALHAVGIYSSISYVDTTGV